MWVQRKQGETGCTLQIRLIQNFTNSTNLLIQRTQLLWQRFDGGGSILSTGTYIYMFAAAIFACLQSTVRFSRNHFWCLQVKKIKLLSHVMTVLGEQLYDGIFVTQMKPSKLGNTATLLHLRSCKPSSAHGEFVRLLTTFTNVFSPKLYLVLYSLLSSCICLNLMHVLKQRGGHGCFLASVVVRRQGPQLPSVAGSLASPLLAC